MTNKTLVFLIILLLLFLVVNKILWGNEENSGGHHDAPTKKKNPQGPWFECMSMTGPECAKFIRQETAGTVKIHFLRVDKDGIYQTKDPAIANDPKHVFIYVNNKNVVQETPARGG